MDISKAGTVAGCLVWMIVFGILSTCLFPVSMTVGGFTSVTKFAMKAIAPLICPEGTTAESYSYATTTMDEHGNSQPSTAYELHCVDNSGSVVKKDPILYAFLWMGIVTLIGLAIAALLALALAAPAGVFIGKMLNRDTKLTLLQTSSLHETFITNL